MAGEELLASWNDTATRQSIIEYVGRVTSDGSGFVAPLDRIATFDNDGTLWCEKPLPIQLAFILQRLASMATADESLRGRQPWKAAFEKDYGWLGGVITKHYAGDDSDVEVLMGGILAAFAGTTVEEYEAQADTFVSDGRHPTLGDPEREFDYTTGAEIALAQAAAEGWTVVSVKNDWSAVFDDQM